MKIKIHESLIILILIALLAGFIKKILLIYSLVLLHEMGHILACYYQKRRIISFELIPFGGIIEFENDKNTHLLSEMLIVIAGPLVNLLLMPFLKGEMAVYNQIILGFNLLPIFPLDGGRIFEIILMRFFYFKRAVKISLLVSVITIMLCSIYVIFEAFSLSVVLVLAFLLYKNIMQYIKREERYMFFLTQKYLYPNPNLKNYFLRITKKGFMGFCHKGVNNNIGIKEKYKSEKYLLDRFFEK